MFEGLRKPMELITIVVARLAYGCPVQAIVYAFGPDERTVAEWRDRAGQHCQRVHEALVEQGQRGSCACAGGRDPRQGVQDDCMDGISHDGFYPVVAGRDSEHEPRQAAG